jgi:hypothetical protein
MDIKPGQIYKHYKGDTYRIITLAKLHDTEEDAVVYERITDIAHTGWKIWIRTVAEFTNNQEVNGEKVPRFVKIKE